MKLFSTILGERAEHLAYVTQAGICGVTLKLASLRLNLQGLLRLFRSRVILRLEG